MSKKIYKKIEEKRSNRNKLQNYLNVIQEFFYKYVWMHVEGTLFLGTPTNGKTHMQHKVSVRRWCGVVCTEITKL